MINIDLGYQLYRFLTVDNQTLPPYRYNFSDIENGGLVFRNEQPETNRYFGDVINAKFSIFYIASTGGDYHLLQLKNMDYIIKKFQDLKSITINDKIYNVIAYDINGLPMPNTGWLAVNLDDFNETNQIYSITFNIFLKEEKC